jgi:hypothetical protein
MSDTLIRGWREETINKVRANAKLNRRSISSEVQSLVETAIELQEQQKPKRISLAELIRGKPVTTRTQAEIDAYVRELRDEWDR